LQQPLPEKEQKNPPVPRRQALRSLLGIATGLGLLVGLAACGGDGEDDEDD
jgi:hypothetical protein